MAESSVNILPNDIIDLSFKSSSALNAEFPAGAELSDIFDLVLIDEQCNGSLPADLSCVENISDGWPDEDLRRVINERAFFGGLFDEDSPDYRFHGLDINLDLVGEEFSHAFTIRVEFKDGHTQTFTTSSVVLKN